MAEIRVERASDSAEEAVRETAPWIEWLARSGYVAKAAVYVLVGVAALFAAREIGSRPAGTRETMRMVLLQPLGTVLLGVLAVGLAGYALWKLVQAALDPGGEGTDAKGILKRLGFAVAGVVYGVLVFAAVRLALEGGGGIGGGRESAADRWTAFALEKPLGRWIIALVGVGVFLYGVYQLYKAVKGKITDQLDLSELSEEGRGRVVLAARLGMGARAVVFWIMGWFLVRAALEYDPREARGIGGALRVLEEQPYGSWLLVAVAVGLVAYGVLELVKARYHRVLATG